MGPLLTTFHTLCLSFATQHGQAFLPCGLSRKSVALIFPFNAHLGHGDRLDEHPLHLVQSHVIGPPVIELRCAG